MTADSHSDIAWHRVQLRKNRDAVKALEIARFRTGDIAGSRQVRKAIAILKRKISQSERCIAAHERQTKRPLATDLRSLATVSWSSWDGRGLGRADRRQRTSANVIGLAPSPPMRTPRPDRRTG